MAEQTVEFDVGENQDMSSLLFIGTQDAYEEFKAKHGIKEDRTVEEEHPEEPKVVSRPKLSLSTSNLELLSEEMTTILRRTRLVHDYNTVYMQSSLDFYDEFYNASPDEVSEEVKRARGIRRVYRDYSKWLEAMDAYYAYIDYLIDKHGEENFEYKVRVGMIKEWLPPKPRLSKSAEDYDLYEAGIIPTISPTLPEEVITEIYNKLMEELKPETDKVEMVGGVEVSNDIIETVQKRLDSSLETSYRSLRTSSPCGSFEDVSRLFRSWYRDDRSASSSSSLFRNAPENIRKRVEEDEIYFVARGLLTRIASGEPIDDEVAENPNEMVVDPVTSKTMPRSEYNTRECIRFMSNYGWDPNRLLLVNSNSKMDKARLRVEANKKNGRKKRRPKPQPDLSDMYDADTFGIDPMYSEQEGLMESVFGLMKGD